MIVHVLLSECIQEGAYMYFESSICRTLLYNFTIAVLSLKCLLKQAKLPHIYENNIIHLNQTTPSIVEQIHPDSDQHDIEGSHRKSRILLTVLWRFTSWQEVFSNRNVSLMQYCRIEMWRIITLFPCVTNTVCRLLREFLLFSVSALTN